MQNHLDLQNKIPKSCLKSKGGKLHLIISDWLMSSQMLKLIDLWYLGHHGFLVLLLLCDFDGWLFGDGWNQEVHQDVLAVGHAVHHGQQAGWDVVCEQVVVVSDGGERLMRFCVYLSPFNSFHSVLLYSAWWLVLRSQQQGSTRSLSGLLPPCQGFPSPNLKHTHFSNLCFLHLRVQTTKGLKRCIQHPNNRMKRKLFICMTRCLKSFWRVTLFSVQFIALIQTPFFIFLSYFLFISLHLIYI